MIGVGNLIALIANYKKYVIIVAVIAAGYGWHKWQVSSAYRAGYKSAVSDINTAAKKLDSDAGQAASDVTACFDKGELWTWNRDTGKCVQS